jgi:hypothetical protein
MADYYVYKMPRQPQAGGKPDKAQMIELEALAGAVSGNDKVIYLAGPRDTAEQKAAIKAVRGHLITRGVSAEQITTSKPVGEPASLTAHA